MALEAIIVLIVLAAVALIVILRQKPAGGASPSMLLRQIAGNFFLVSGVLLLFPACYLLFHGGSVRRDAWLLVVSLLTIFGGNLLANRSGKK